jgi:hypothetical protein
MLVTLNILMEHDKQAAVRAAIEGIEGIARIDTGLLRHDVLVVHAERRNAQQLKKQLQEVDGIVSAQVGSIATAD